MRTTTPTALTHRKPSEQQTGLGTSSEEVKDWLHPVMHTGDQLARYRLFAMTGILIAMAFFFVTRSPLPEFFEAESGYYHQWSAMRAQLGNHSDPATLRILEHLHFYDLPMRYVVSWEGLGYVLAWNLWREYCVWEGAGSADTTASNHGLSMWYFRPYGAIDPDVRNPTKWNFDVLESVPFPESMVQDSADLLRNHAGEIRREFETSLESRMTAHPDAKTEVDAGHWDWNFLYGTTGKNQDVCSRAPITHGVIQQLPVTYNYGFVFFSKLAPGTHINAHTGSTNLRIRLHLGIRIPEEKGYTATIRVGSQHQAWRQDDVLVFDDAFEHEIRYDGKSERVVLIVDLWHPDVTTQERELLSYQGFGPFGTKGTTKRKLD